MKPPQRVPAVLSVLVPSLGLAQTAPVPQPWLDATLALAERGEWAALKLQARRQPDPMARLYAAYLLYRQAPQEHRTGFLEALPEDEAGRRAYAGLAALLETDSASGRRPRPPPDLWALQDSLLVLAKGGEEKAIRWLLAIPRYGDGGIREGLGQDALELFKEPALVARHWKLFEARKQSLRALQTWTYPQNYPAIRAGYAKAFAHRPNLRDEVLALMDSPE